MPRCSSCGVEFTRDAVYCQQCGRPIRDVKTKQLVLNSERLVEKVREPLREGNVTRMTVKDERGNLLLDLPVAVGVVWLVLAPLPAAVGAIAAVATK